MKMRSTVKNRSHTQAGLGLLELSGALLIFFTIFLTAQGIFEQYQITENLSDIVNRHIHDDPFKPFSLTSSGKLVVNENALALGLARCANGAAQEFLGQANLGSAKCPGGADFRFESEAALVNIDPQSGRALSVSPLARTQARCGELNTSSDLDLALALKSYSLAGDQVSALALPQIFVDGSESNGRYLDKAVVVALRGTQRPTNSFLRQLLVDLGISKSQTLSSLAVVGLRGEVG